MSKNPTVNLNALCLLACEDVALFSWVDLHLSLCEQQHPNCERAIRLVYSASFLKHRSSSSPTNKKSNGVSSGDSSNSSISVTIRNFTYVHVHSPSHSDRCYCLSNQLPFPLNHPVFNYRYYQYMVKHKSINDFIKVHYLHYLFRLQYIFPREGDHWRDLDVDGWIILVWISEMWDVGIWTGLAWARIGTVGGHLWVR